MENTIERKREMTLTPLVRWFLLWFLCFDPFGSRILSPNISIPVGHIK